MKLQNSKFLNSNWIITLTATLIGVFGALFLNECVTTKKIGNQKSIATKNILSEIKKNEKEIEKSLKMNIAVMETYIFKEKYMDDQKRLITDVDSMQTFRTNFPDIVTVTDSTLLKNGKYHYKADVNLDLNFSYLTITNIAWKTLKSSNLTNFYDFDCLMFLEGLEIFTNETLKYNRKVIDLLINKDKYEENDYEKLFKQELKLLIMYEKGLLEGYKNSEEELNNCG